MKDNIYAERIFLPVLLMLTRFYTHTRAAMDACVIAIIRYFPITNTLISQYTPRKENPSAFVRSGFNSTLLQNTYWEIQFFLKLQEHKPYTVHPQLQNGQRDTHFGKLKERKGFSLLFGVLDDNYIACSAKDCQVTGNSASRR
jgi:hypothetical protein